MTGFTQTKIRLLLLVFAFFEAGLRLFAQPFSLAFNHLNRENGLIEGYNWFVDQDSRGFIWISSLYGLNRFDGQRVRTWESNRADSTALFGKNIQSHFFEDDESNIWFSTYEAVHCYRRKTGDFQRYFLPDSHEKNYKAFALDGEQNLWVRGENGHIWRMDTRSGKSQDVFQTDFEKPVAWLDSKKRLEKMLIFSSNRAEADFVVFAENQVKSRKTLHFFLPNDSKKEFHLLQVLFENEEIVWLAGAEGLLRFELPTQKTQLFQGWKNQTDPCIWSVAEWHNRWLLCASKSDGLLVFDRSTNQFSHQFRHSAADPASISSNELEAVSTDRTGNIWVSLKSGGIDFCQPDKSKKVERVLFSELEDWPLSARGSRVTSVFENEENQLWVGLKNGQLVRLDDSKQQVLETIAPPTKAMGTRAHFFTDFQKNRWLILPEGVFLLAPKQKKYRRVFNTSNGKAFFLKGCAMPDGRVLLSNSHGVFEARLENGALKTSRLASVDSASSFTNLFFDKKNGWLFLARDANDLQVFKSKSGVFEFQKNIATTGDVYSWSMSDDQKSLWIGSENGLLQLNLSDLEEKRFPPEYNVFCIQPDGRDRTLWLSTNQGLYKFDLKTNTARPLDRSEIGMNHSFVGETICRTMRGELIFGGDQMLLALKTGRFDSLRVEAEAQIVQILVNDAFDSTVVCQKTGATNPTEIQRLVFPFKKNTLTFDLAALEFSDPERTKIRYRLRGQSENWLEIENRSVRLPQLQPNEYTLEVQAANSEGRWSPKIRVVEILILPPWYQTWWARVLFVLLITGVGAFIFWLNFREKLKKLQWQETVRRRLARDLHDEMGSSLSAIQLLSGMGQKSAAAATNKETSDRFEKIKDIILKSQVSMRDLIWVLDAKRETVGDLLSHVREFAEPLADEKHLILRFELDESLKTQVLKPETRQNLYYIFREAFNNALKYSYCTTIDVQFLLEKRRLFLEIHDDGHGFDFEKIKRGEGLQNMTRRAAEIKGQLRFDTAAERGTRVLVEVPV